MSDFDFSILLVIILNKTSIWSFSQSIWWLYIQLNWFTYNSIKSFLLKVKTLSSSLTTELEVFSNIFCCTFFLVKYTFMKLFFSVEFNKYFFASWNLAELTIKIEIKYSSIYFLFLVNKIFLSPLLILI